MYRLLRFAGPGKVEIIESQSVALQPGEVRVRTLFSGISAGTEMTAYRGTNPYLTSVWNPGIRLFQQDLREPRLGYPLDGWGYSEVGEVVEVAAVPDPVDEGKDAGRPVKVGDTVWGIWGHQSEAILPAKTVAGHQLPEGMDPLAAVFVRVGAIALNAVLAADLGVGSTVAIFGQGVIGLLATRFAVLNGATVIAVTESGCAKTRHSLGVRRKPWRRTRIPQPGFANLPAAWGAIAPLNSAGTTAPSTRPRGPWVPMAQWLLPAFTRAARHLSAWEKSSTTTGSRYSPRKSVRSQTGCAPGGAFPAWNRQ